jgi:superfamily II DNA or RNA helicase
MTKIIADFLSEFLNDGAALVKLERAASRKAPFGKGTTEVVAFDNWAIEGPDAALSAIAVLQEAWAEDSLDTDGGTMIDPSEACVRLAPGMVARLSDGQALALDLPRAAPLVLELNSHSSLDEEDFRLDPRWVRISGAPAYAKVNGARLNYDGVAFRLVEPIYSLIAAVKRLNEASDEAERYARFAELKALLPEGLDSAARPDGYVEGLRIAYAAGFSLQFDAADQGFIFDPVLFSRRTLLDAGAGNAVDEADDSLLSPRVQDRFARRFRGSDEVRSAYLVGDGGIVYLDPDLKSALGVVRQAQRSDSETRRAFVRNPRRFVREALKADESSDAAASLDALFVETEQFSQRVTGVEVWRKPVLPWIQPSPTSWLPERFGLRIGEEPDAISIELDHQQAKAALAEVEAAITAGVETVQVKGKDGEVELPASPKVVELLRGLASLGEPPAREAPAAPADSPERFFLKVKDNLDTVDFAPILKKSAVVAESAPEPPVTLRSTLKTHQLEGYAWLVAAWQSGSPGVLLADDMGLGKTLQALAFLAWVRESHASRQPALVVAPTGLLSNWAEEIERHLAANALGGLVRAYGSGLAALRTVAGRDTHLGGSTLDPDRWAHAGLVLTTYETLRDYQFSFARTPFSVIIYDEVQKLKNPASQVTAAARSLNARFQIGMTGTPVENRLQDLWSIFDVVHPALLGSSREFERTYGPADVAKLQRLNDQLTKSSDGRPPVMLRRMKHGNIEGLPDKTSVSYPVEMPAPQAAAYAEVVRRATAARGAGADRGRMLEVLHQLRSVSLHAHPPESGAANFDAYAADSARLKQLFTIIDGIAEKKEKVLVFCESLAMQAQLAVHIRRRYHLDHPVVCISGKLAGDKRQAAVGAFQARSPGFDIMVLSPKAGGVGLTLTAANHVVHLSRWWNPAVEDQSTDRVHRIGQTRPVTVHLPLAIHPDPAIRESSFDLKLDALMTRKRRLSQDLLAPPEGDGDLASLFDEVTHEQISVKAAEPPPSDGEPPAPVQIASPLRQQLTLPKPVSAPLPSSPATWPARIKFQPGSRRDWRIFSGPLQGETIIACGLRDPYAGGRADQRRYTAEFFAQIASWANLKGDVRVTCWDADSAAGRYGGETNKEQHADFQKAWAKALGSSAPRLIVQPKSSRAGTPMHDRSFEVRTASGHRFLWDLGSGIEGLMRDDKECTVSLHHVL